jgi:hypothetical protein
MKLVLLVVILFIKVLKRFLVPLVERKLLRNAGKNGSLILSNVLGAEAFKCRINNLMIFDLNFVKLK